MINKMMIAMIAVTAIFTVTAVNVKAEVVCYEAVIDQVAAVADDADETTAPYQLRLTCNSPSDLWPGSITFDMGTDLGEGGYATALTAYSLGHNVKVVVSAPSWYALIQGIYILKP